MWGARVLVGRQGVGPSGSTGSRGLRGRAEGFGFRVSGLGLGARGLALVEAPPKPSTPNDKSKRLIMGHRGPRTSPRRVSSTCPPRLPKTHCPSWTWEVSHEDSGSSHVGRLVNRRSFQTKHKPSAESQVCTGVLGLPTKVSSSTYAGTEFVQEVA